MKKIDLSYGQAVFMWTGFVTGNFFYQAVTDLDWGVAAERSFFQGGMVAALILVSWLRSFQDGPER